MTLRAGMLVAFLAWALLTVPPAANAADNAALGGIGGVNNGTLLGGDGTGEARISLFAVDLALVKQARDLTGTVLPDGTDVSPGQDIYFVLYLDNPTDAPATDLQLIDLLNEADFAYQAGSLEQTLVPSGSSDAAIWAGAWTPLTDPVGGPDDDASATDSGGAAGIDRVTVGAEPTQTNQTVSVPASSLRAFRFRVRVN